MTMVTQQQRTAYVIEVSYNRLDKFLRRAIYTNMCQHDNKCFDLCQQNKLCLNTGIVIFAWSLMAKSN